MISYYLRNRRVLITLVRLPAGLCRFPLHTACKFKEFSGILLCQDYRKHYKVSVTTLHTLLITLGLIKQAPEPVCSAEVSAPLCRLNF